MDRPSGLSAFVTDAGPADAFPPRLLRRRGAALLVAAASVAAAPAAARAVGAVEDLRQLSIEELANVEITSVSRRPEPLSGAPAAIYVITGEEIRRSGATSLPEALRLAPNLHVARETALNYAISARGFGGAVAAANKLLVMLDGRSLYTPLFGGVFWDQEQPFLDDIDRIEVISGPGGTLYGANAMNGVVNIVTKKAQATSGGLAVAHVGDFGRSLAARYGGALGDAGAYRVYARGFEQDESLLANGNGANDDWEGRQTGFRTDWSAMASTFTVQGDVYDNPARVADSSGHNLLGRWTTQFGAAGTLELQGYYDASEREAATFDESLRTFDVEGRHIVRLGERHTLVWGGGYRTSEDEFITPGPAVLDPAEETVTIGNVFVQDSIALRDDLTLTLGHKLEHSSYSGAEHLPSARLSHQFSPNALLWSAVSRAVRTPTRIDRDISSPGAIDPAPDFGAEELVAYEIGYRGRPTPASTLSISFFYNRYDEVRALARSPATGRLVLDNAMEGTTHGADIWGDYRPLGWWRLSAGLSLIDKDLELKPPGLPIGLSQHAGNDPEYRLTLRSHMDLGAGVRLDVGLRAIDELPDPKLPGYVEVDVAVAWQVADGLELSLAGFNLLDESHPEVATAGGARELPRSVYVGARVKF